MASILHQFCQSILSKLSNNVNSIKRQRIWGKTDFRRLIKRDYLLHVNLENPKKKKKKTLISDLAQWKCLIYTVTVWWGLQFNYYMLHLFFSEIYWFSLLLNLLFTYLCTKNLTLPLRNLWAPESMHVAQINRLGKNLWELTFCPSTSSCTAIHSILSSRIKADHASPFLWSIIWWF